LTAKEAIMALSRRDFVRTLGAGGAFTAAMMAGRGQEALGGLVAGGFVPTLHAAAGPIRLDSNENPNGPCQASVDAIRGAFGEACRYPRTGPAELLAAIAKHHRVAPENVLLGSGSGEILRMAAFAFTTAGRPLVQASPTFESPARDAELIGTPVVSIPVDASLRLDLAAMAARAGGAGLVFLCNPNNPTGTVHGAAAVSQFISRVLKASPATCILVDEAYHEFVDDAGYRTSLPLALDNPQVVVTRTFSKVYGMAGLRVGYAVAHADTIRSMSRFRIANNVNVLGAAAAIAALPQADHVARQAALNREAREFTRRAFTDAGYKVAASEANFVMVEIRRDARAFQEACKLKGVLVGRPFAPLTTHARVSIGTMDEMRRALDILRAVLAKP
jgi:histidinol-phosphate aminotransferase